MTTKNMATKNTATKHMTGKNMSGKYLPTKDSHPGRQRIVVLGGGYAGLTAALRLAPHHQVTLVDPRTDFVERVRLHELAAGTRSSVRHAYQTLLAGTGITHLRARAVDIDVSAGRSNSAWAVG